MELTNGRLIGGRYQAKELIGRGGIAVVYLAHDQKLNRDVAVKVLAEHVADDPMAAQRLQREARSVAQLDSPHVVRVLDSGIDDGQPFLVMEYLQHGSLADAVAKRLPLPAETVATYGRQIALGLAAAHAQGFIHRDVTMRNILVADAGHLKLTDFGIARVTDGATLTRTGVALGTAIAMAPEQASGGTLTPATDVYGLGVVLYQLATGRPPFTGDTDVAIVLQHIQAPVVPPRRLNPAVPEWLDAIIMRALAKDPAERYPDGGAMAAALAEGLASAAQAVPATAEATTATLPLAAAGAGSATAALPASGAPAALGSAAAGVPRRWGAGSRATPSRNMVPLIIAGSLAVLLLAGALLTRAGDQPARGPTPDTAAPVAAATRAPAPTTPPTATAPPPTATPVPATATPVPPTATAAPPTPTPEPALAPDTKPDKKNDNKKKPDKKAEQDAEAGDAQKKAQAPASAPTMILLDNSAFVGGFSNPAPSMYADQSGEQRSATWLYGGKSDYASMTARFTLPAETPAGARLVLVGMDGEDPPKMPIRVTLNDQVVFEGDNPLPDWRWGSIAISVPAQVLRSGENQLTIRTLSDQANFNSPHFFMLDQARLEWDASPAT